MKNLIWCFLICWFLFDITSSVAATSPNDFFHSQRLNKQQQKIKLKSWQKKIHPALLVELTQSRGLAANSFIEETTFHQIQSHSAALMRVRVLLTNNHDHTIISLLKNHGMVVDKYFPQRQVVVGWLSAQNMQTVAALPTVVKIDLPSEAFFKTSLSVAENLEGDIAQQSNVVRDSLGFDGSNIRIGVISDGIKGLQDALNDGVLPHGQNSSCGTLSAITCQTFHTEGLEAGAEGTALLEILHNIAPQAQLYFTNINDTDSFKEAVAYLASRVDIIIDDIGFYAEPYFHDGEVAQEVEKATQQGIIFVSAAGNDANKHLQENFSDTNNDGFHDFSGAQADSFLVKIDQPTNVVVYLQWNDFPNTPTTDFDLYVCALNEDKEPIINKSGQAVCYSSQSHQTDTQISLEKIGLKSLTHEKIYLDIRVEHISGSTNNKILEMFVMSKSDGVELEYSHAEDSIFGHPAVENVIAVGAYRDATVAAYSSQGPVSVGNEQRAKPDIVALDGISVGGYGNFSSPFYGTSAAAPHVAGCAALMLHANPTLTASQIKNILYSTTQDLETFGFDFISGHGQINCEEAVKEALITEGLGHHKNFYDESLSPQTDDLDADAATKEEAASEELRAESAGCALQKQITPAADSGVLFLVLLLTSVLLSWRYTLLTVR